MPLPVNKTKHGTIVIYITRNCQLCVPLMHQHFGLPFEIHVPSLGIVNIKNKKKYNLKIFSFRCDYSL